ncbi:hypothetical protein K439DRAFT_1525641 [Ramaria rubella]|nr:hypothetical protein K439DRAFT_1525641 [Ramaria rubella]
MLSKLQFGLLDPVIFVMGYNGPSACCHVECGGLRILAPDNLGDVSASILKDNFDIVYQVTVHRVVK